MSTEEQDLFLRFQREISTTPYFCVEGLRERIVQNAEKSLITTEMFIHENHSGIEDKWVEYKEQGKLTHELIDAIYAKERNIELHEKKDHILGQMEQLNIIVKARSFNEHGVKESPRKCISPEHDSRMVSTSVLCWVFTGTFLPPSIFQRLLAACLSRWPVAKSKETSENLTFYGCTVFDLDLIHRLTLHCNNHVVFARITRMGIDDKTLNAKLSTRVRKFISLNLIEITSCMDKNLEYELCVQIQESQDVPEDIRSRFSPPFQMSFLDEGHDPDAPITREHMNHARLCVALVTVCGNAMREILLTNFPVQYKNIYKAILANQARLAVGQGRLLNKDQIQLVFPDKKGRYTGTVDQFDLSLLYTLIRNVSTVPAPKTTGWGIDPKDQPRDNSLGASVERIRLYRNHISGHSPDGKISQRDFEDYWNKFDAVLHDIEAVIGRPVYIPELGKQKRQVISVYEAC